MDTHSIRIRKTVVLILAAVLFLFGTTVVSARAATTEDINDEGNSKRPEITIEVVEDIAAAEIEEQEVPLADTPLTAAAGNTRSTVIKWTLGAVIAAYMVFLITGMNRRKKRRR